MKQQEASALVLALRAAFAVPPWDKATVDLYETKMATLKDPDLARQAVENLVDSATFRPPVAAVLNEYLTLARKKREEQSRSHGLPEPEVTEDERQMNLKRLRDLYAKVGWGETT